MIKIAITGPESSGKSQLAAQLSSHFSEPFAPEYAREYLAKTAGKYGIKDLNAITAGQLRSEVAAISRASNLCFFDTDMLVMEVWSEFRFVAISRYIRSARASVVYDAHLLCYPDLDWTSDPLRESPNLSERIELFECYHAKLNAGQIPFMVVKGRGDERWQKAAAWVGEFLQN